MKYLKIWSTFSAIILLLMMAYTVEAKRFANQYCEFELPTGWQCALEGSEWVCQSVNKGRQKEAIIILAAKIRGSQDSLDQYQAYLRSPKTYNLPGGKTQVSEAKYTKTKNINGHRWVDSLHLASEVPGFYTRYVATVKVDLGVAVTFSVSKDHYTAYQGVFDKVVATLRVFRQKKMDMSKFKLKGKNENLLDNTTFVPDDDDAPDVSHTRKRKRKGGFMEDSTNIMLLVIVAAIAGFLYMKKKKKGKKGKKKKKKKKKDSSEE